MRSKGLLCRQDWPVILLPFGPRRRTPRRQRLLNTPPSPVSRPRRHVRSLQRFRQVPKLRGTPGRSFLEYPRRRVTKPLSTPLLGVPARSQRSRRKLIPDPVLLDQGQGRETRRPGLLPCFPLSPRQTVPPRLLPDLVALCRRRPCGVPAGAPPRTPCCALSFDPGPQEVWCLLVSRQHLSRDRGSSPAPPAVGLAL